MMIPCGGFDTDTKWTAGRIHLLEDTLSHTLGITMSMTATLPAEAYSSAAPTAVKPVLPATTSPATARPTTTLPATAQPATVRIAKLIERVMQQTDDLVLVLDYEGKDGSRTRRVVSPIRFVAENRFLALCLSREEPRQFYLDRCSNVRVGLSGNYVMPVEIQSLS